jgi:hypothetical protein
LPSTRDDERSAREVSVGACRRLVVVRVPLPRELLDRPVERPVDLPLPDERDDPPERDRDREREP